MSLDKHFRNELKSMLSSSVPNHSTLSDREAKHVSWVVIEEDDNKSKRKSRSTPFPKRKTPKEELNLKPTTLSFNEDNESKEEIITHPSKKRKISESTQDYNDFKKKLSEKAVVSSDLNSGWLEVDVSSPKPKSESDSDISTENIVVSEIDPHGILAKQILARIRESKILENASTADESSQNDTFTTLELDQIELYSSNYSSARLSDSEFSSSDEDILFKVPKIVKNAKKFKNRCQIVEAVNSNVLPDISTKCKHPINKTKKIRKSKKIHNLADENIQQLQTKDTLKKTFVIESKENLKIVHMKNGVNSTEEENLNSDSPSTDDEFLLDNETYINNTKEISYILSESKNKNNTVSDSVQFYLSRNQCILVLTHPVKLYFCGKLSISVLSGAVAVLGHIFGDDTKDVELYSPKGQSYLYISTQKGKGKENISEILESYDINVEKEKLNNVCVISLKNIENNVINCIINHTFQQLFPKVITTFEERSLSILEMRLQCYIETELSDWPNLEIDEQWETLIGSFDLSKKLSLMVCGGKGVGKSTFLRFTTNKFLQNLEKIVYIDLDPGQPEFTIPGCISITIIDKPLLGPNYTHLRKPDRCYFLGEVDVSHCFSNYLKAIEDLISFYKNEIDQTIPCVINYMGFTKGLGIDLITSIIPIVNPTILLQIEGDDSKRNFPTMLSTNFIMKHAKSLPFQINTANLDYDLQVLKSAACRSKKRPEFEAKVLRNMCISAYFAQMLTSGDEKIASMKPYCANLSALNLQHIHGHKENLIPIINGNLVALCDNTVSNCVGFGIVRGIDVNGDKIYLITPESNEVMKKVTTLVMGVIMLPPSFYATGELYDGNHPYICRTVRRATTGIPKRSYRACQYLLAKK